MLFERTLSIKRDALGERDPDYAATLNNLAALLVLQGDYVAARPLYERALAIWKDVYGERHPDYASCLNNLAGLLESQGDAAAARSLYERAMEIAKEVRGEQSVDYATTVNNLAHLLRSQGDYAAVRSLFEQALAIKKKVLGEHHPDYASSLNNLAFTLKSQGDYTAARPLFERALAIRKEVLGEDHPQYAEILGNLGYLSWARGDVVGAAELETRALEVAEGNLELAAIGQSERQQLAMLLVMRGRLDSYLSVAPVAQRTARDAYLHVLVTKGAVFECQRRLRGERRRLQTDRGSAAARKFAEYSKTVTQLSALAPTTPGPRNAPEWKIRLEQLSRQKDQLEAELSGLDPEFRAAAALAIRTPEQVQAALPDDASVLIDYLIYTAYRPPAEGKGDFSRDRRLVAFVVRRDRPIGALSSGRSRRSRRQPTPGVGSWPAAPRRPPPTNQLRQRDGVFGSRSNRISTASARC